VSHTARTSPIFVKSGSITALAPNMMNTSDANWSQLALDVYPSKTHSGGGTLYEDDTKTIAYKDGFFRTTDYSVSYDNGGKRIIIDIGAAKGNFSGERAFTNRDYKIRVHVPDGWGKVKSVKAGDKKISGVNFYEKSGEASPLAYGGAARDSDIYEFTVSASVLKAQSISVNFSDDPVLPPALKPKGISAGAIIGISTGGAALAALAAFAIVWFAVKKRGFADLKYIFKKKNGDDKAE
jgi:hypothetical protein